MRAIKFEEVNCVMRRPASMGVDQCNDLPVCIGETPEGIATIVSCFELNESEIKELIGRRRIYLIVAGQSMPPVSLNIKSPFTMIDYYVEDDMEDNKDSGIVKIQFEVMEGGKMPTRSTDGSAGWDIYAKEPVLIYAKDSKVLPLGLKSSFPKNIVGIMKDRSGMAAKVRGTRRAGVIDSDYRGEWGVVFVNESEKMLEIKAGDRIAQVLFLELPAVSLEEVDNVNLENDRGGGFGSTGK